ncbi:replicative DNA helicase [Psychrobacillus psychrodurans]|uniref:Replicative DNA helicase n=1 Tax=Psychrobacillus psychrodurans TaxID=126157 RepID=A0A9X3L8L6_9BACI|nr:replicative DNA helicase [Psychrobacillus psychrodurans]MCZ8533336.1 replicative DNA helicase [Psychrobacillus psychrodurans]
MDLKDIVLGYGERYERILLFEPLNKLSGMQKKDGQNQPIDMRGLGLLTLLYFFEQKIMRNTKAGKKQLAQFLFQTTSEHVSVTLEQYNVLAGTIIETFRPGSGKVRTAEFFNWETGQNEIVAYQYLKASSFDVSTNEQYYLLDEHGLELVFATKEFYSEFQLSISQLVLRKQLEKGEFKGALRQINEMRVAVESIEEQLSRLQNEIRRNIVSNEVFHRYEKLIDDISFRLKYENEEFNELAQFINEAKERLHYKDTQKKESDAYNLVLTISYELEKVHAYHTKLLQKSIELQTTALEAAKEALYYIGVESFNFDLDVTARIISNPLPVSSLKSFVVPFFTVHEERQWSLFSIFDKQNVFEERVEQEIPTLLEIDEEKKQLRNEQMVQFYSIVLKLLLQKLELHNEITLEQWFEYIRQEEQTEPLLTSRYVYDFFLLLHQRSPIEVQEDTGEETYLWTTLHRILNGIALEIQELPNILHVTDRFTIQNMRITKRSEVSDVL